MVDDMLDFARIERGVLACRPREVDLVPVVRLSLVTLRGLRGGERVRADLPEHFPAYADPERCGQIVNRLVANALQHAPGTEVTVRLYTPAGGAPAGPPGGAGRRAGHPRGGAGQGLGALLPGPGSGDRGGAPGRRDRPGAGEGHRGGARGSRSGPGAAPDGAAGSGSTSRSRPLVSRTQGDDDGHVSAAGARRSSANQGGIRCRNRVGAGHVGGASGTGARWPWPWPRPGRRWRRGAGGAPAERGGAGRRRRPGLG